LRILSIEPAINKRRKLKQWITWWGQVPDSQEPDTLLLGTESQLYADAAYSSAETRETLARFGIADCLQRKG